MFRPGCVTERILLVCGWIGARVDTRALRVLRPKAAQSFQPPSAAVSYVWSGDVDGDGKAMDDAPDSNVRR